MRVEVSAIASLAEGSAGQLRAGRAALDDAFDVLVPSAKYPWARAEGLPLTDHARLAAARHLDSAISQLDLAAKNGAMIGGSDAWYARTASDAAEYARASHALLTSPLTATRVEEAIHLAHESRSPLIEQAANHLDDVASTFGVTTQRRLSSSLNQKSLSANAGEITGRAKQSVADADRLIAPR